MAIKIVQDAPITRLAPSAGVAITSNSIALQSGYLRITVGSTDNSGGGYIAIGTNPTVTRNHYHLTSYTTDVIKERMSRQVISGIVTGSSTTLLFGENNGNPFLKTDYVTILGCQTVGLNTAHVPIISMGQNDITLGFDSSSITNPNVQFGQVYRSVKVAFLTDDAASNLNICEVVLLAD